MAAALPSSPHRSAASPGGWRPACRGAGAAPGSDKSPPAPAWPGRCGSYARRAGPFGTRGPVAAAGRGRGHPGAAAVALRAESARGGEAWAVWRGPRRGEVQGRSRGPGGAHQSLGRESCVRVAVGVARGSERVCAHQSPWSDSVSVSTGVQTSGSVGGRVCVSRFWGRSVQVSELRRSFRVGR